MTAVLTTSLLLLLSLLTGFELCVAVILPLVTRGLGHDARLRSRADSASTLGRVMPGWYAATAVLGAGVAWLRPTPLTIGTCILLVTVIVGTLALLVPLNSRLARWSVAHHPADWARHVDRWDRRHRVRVCLLGVASIAAFAGTSFG